MMRSKYEKHPPEKEKFWVRDGPWQYIALAAIVATVTAAAMAGMFAILTRFLP